MPSSSYIQEVFKVTEQAVLWLHTSDVDINMCNLVTIHFTDEKTETESW